MGKKIVALSVLLAGLCAVQTARGAYTGSIKYKYPPGEPQLFGHIDFGVFDRQTDNFAYTPPGDGRYIYAYQIYNDQDSIEAVGYFAILLAGAAFDGIGSDAHVNDTEAVEPSSAYLVDSTGKLVFEFKSVPEGGPLLGEDILEPGMHSYILMFTSDNDWVPGSFQIKGGDLGDYEPELPVVPEPATILILGMGAGTALIMKRRTS